MWGGSSDGSWEPSDEGDSEHDDEEEGTSSEQAVRRRQAQCYALVPYCDLSSWRGRLIVHPTPLEAFCEQLLLPLPLLAGWIRATSLEDEDPVLGFYQPSADGMPRPDPFFVSVGEHGRLLLTRGAQRFLQELDAAHGGAIRRWGEARANDECFVDEEEEEERQAVVDWCAVTREQWAKRFRRHLVDNLGNSDGGAEGAGERSKKEEEREKHVKNLEKKLRTKKGKANLVRRTHKQKKKDKAMAAEGASNSNSDSAGLDSD